MAFQDSALRKAFPNGLQGEIVRGASGTGVVAVQYALGRLGHLHDLCDGKFGGNTETALKVYQRAVGLPVTGKVDAALLTDDLPPSAYADPGFVQFLKTSAAQRD